MLDYLLSRYCGVSSHICPAGLQTVTQSSTQNKGSRDRIAHCKALHVCCLRSYGRCAHEIPKCNISIDPLPRKAHYHTSLHPPTTAGRPPSQPSRTLSHPLESFIHMSDILIPGSRPPCMSSSSCKGGPRSHGPLTPAFETARFPYMTVYIRYLSSPSNQSAADGITADPPGTLESSFRTVMARASPRLTLGAGSSKAQSSPTLRNFSSNFFSQATNSPTPAWKVPIPLLLSLFCTMNLLEFSSPFPPSRVPLAHFVSPSTWTAE